MFDALNHCATATCIGKLRAFKLLRANEMERNVILFGEDDASLDELMKIGKRFIMHLYKPSTKSTFKTLDELRYQYVKSPKYIPIERMPTTSRAGSFHLPRVHLHVHTWEHLKTILPIEQWGFKIVGENIMPIITDLPVAPDYKM